MVDGFLLSASTTPKSVVNFGPKVGPNLNKKLISMMFFMHGFHCLMVNNKAALSALPL